MIEAAGLTLSSGPYSFPTPHPAIRQNIVSLPDVYVGLDDFEKPGHVLFKRCLYVMANTFGFPNWPSYGADGNYRTQR